MGIKPTSIIPHIKTNNVVKTIFLENLDEFKLQYMIYEGLKLIHKTSLTVETIILKTLT